MVTSKWTYLAHSSQSLKLKVIAYSKWKLKLPEKTSMSTKSVFV